MAGNIAFTVIIVIGVLFALMMLGFAWKDRREGRALAAQPGWQYEAAVTRAPVPMVTASTAPTNATFSHVVTAPDGATVFRRQHSERQWNGDGEGGHRVRVSRLFVHLPASTARPCAVAWDPGDGIRVESGDTGVEAAVAGAPFEAALTAHGRHDLIHIGVSGSDLLIETTRGAAVKDMPTYIDWARSVERLLPQRR